MLEQLVTAVHTGKLRPRDLVESALHRIERDNPALNAVTELCIEQAYLDADAHDCRGPLAGIPVLVKDLVAARGTRNTHGGVPLFADAPPDTEDDPTVKALRDAGAIVIGRSNSPSFGHMGITTNPLFGPTRNPWNLQRTPCGSSGGAGAALAAGLAGICTSSDGGGSTRAPAALCGLVGYKPSAGLFRKAHSARLMGTSTVGAMGASVSDCLMEARALVGAEPDDLMAPPPGSVRLDPRMPRRILACNTLTGKTTPQIGAAFERIVRQIEADLRMPVEWIENPVPLGFMDRFETGFNAEIAAFCAPWRAHWDSFEASLKWLIKLGNDAGTIDVMQSMFDRYAICGLFERLLAPDAVLLTPTLNVHAPGPGKRTGPGEIDPEAMKVLEEEFSGAGNTMHFNASGHPAINVPMGIDADGVPMGLQIAAPRWQDGLAFGMAEAIERIAPWPKAAPGYVEFGADLI